MNQRERVQAALRGEPLPHPPVALWRHFPEADGSAESLARAHLAFQERFRFDLLKVTPASGYYGDDWGLRAEHRPNREGVRTYLDIPVKEPADWRRLKALDVNDGAYGRELRAISLVRKALDPAVPVFATVFSPLTVARTLASESAVLLHMRKEQAALHGGLETIAEVTRRFAAALVQAGADGIFFATQMAAWGLATKKEYQEYGRPYDLHVLEAVSSSSIVVVHIHGEDSYFDLFLDYPAAALNWHDRRTSPRLGNAREMYPRCLAGGIDESRFAERRPEEVAAEVQEAIRETGGTRHIVAPGCVIPIDSPAENIDAAVSAARE